MTPPEPPQPGDRPDPYIGIDGELEWRRDQMKRNWPVNQHGSKLTQGEWAALQAEVGRLTQENAGLREALADAAITMRNYYAQAISRATVDEKLEKYHHVLGAVGPRGSNP